MFYNRSSQVNGILFLINSESQRLERMHGELYEYIYIYNIESDQIGSDRILVIEYLLDLLASTQIHRVTCNRKQKRQRRKKKAQAHTTIDNSNWQASISKQYKVPHSFQPYHLLYIEIGNEI